MIKDVTLPSGSEPERLQSVNALNSLWLVGYHIIVSLCPSWSGFMQEALKGGIYDTSRVVVLPFINLDPNNLSTINSALHFAQHLCVKYGKSVCPVTFDQPLYIKAVDILEVSNDLKKVFVRLGGFHILMSFMGSIGNIMSGSGLEELWESVYGRGSVVHMMSGHAYSRALRAHFLTQAALGQILLQTPNCLEGTDTEQLKTLYEAPLVQNEDPDDVVEEQCVKQVTDTIGRLCHQVAEKGRTLITKSEVGTLEVGANSVEIRETYKVFSLNTRPSYHGEILGKNVSAADNAGNDDLVLLDSFHMLSDVVALIVGFASVRISKWRTQKNTFGWARAEVLGALVNAVFLVALCFSILVEALKRLVEVEEIKDPKLLLIVGVLGLLVNIVGLFLFHNHGHSHGGHGHGHSHGGPDEHTESDNLMQKQKFNGSVMNREALGSDEESENVIEIEMVLPKKAIASGSQLNMRGVFLHVLGDALGSIIVVISALVIWFGEGKWVYYMDPGMSIVMVCIILSTTIPLLKESGFILLQTVPTHIQVTDIKEKIEKITGVLAVHEFHVWQLAGNRIIASAHLRCHNLKEYMSIASTIKDLFHNEGIHSTTIQPEFVDVEESALPDSSCMLACGPDKHCYPDTCCPKPKPKSNSEEPGGSGEQTTVRHRGGDSGNENEVQDRTEIHLNIDETSGNK
ncbi:hypothetical protein ScPMuIL_015494 [Solemya velum]